MADRKITELSAMSAGGQATGDLVTIVDVSEAAAADKNKKMTMENLFKGIPGDVGIGVSSPSSPLHISSSEDRLLLLQSSDANAYLAFQDSDSSGNASNRVGTVSDGLYFNTGGGGTRMTIDSSGNVGIGTTSPSALLHVAKGDGDPAEFKLGNTEGTYKISSNANVVTHDSDQHLFRNAAASTEYARIDSSGRLLVGSTSALDATAGAITSNNSSSGGRLALGGNPSGAGSSVGEVFGWWNGNKVAGFVAASGADTTNKDDGELLFYTSASGPSVQERMRIDRSGNTGIGTTSPNFLLDVNGNVGLTEGQVLAWHDGSGNKAGDIYMDSSDNIVFRQTSAVNERMRIDSSGRLLVGSTSSRANGYGDNASLQLEGTSYPKAAISAILNSGNANGPSLNFAKTRGSNGSSTVVQSGDNLGVINFSGGDGTDIKSTGARIRVQVDGTPGSNDMPGRISFETTSDGSVSPTERVRITSAGATIFSTAPDTTFSRSQGGNPGILCNSSSGATTAGLEFATDSTSTRHCVAFTIASTGVGSITTSGSSTAYNTSSDYRLKENIVDITDGITRVKQLSPKRFNFISEEGKTVDGFLAHEAQTVVPEAVTGTHNEVQVWDESEDLPDGVSAGDNKLDEDGNTIPQYQGIDQSKLVPLLTAALQEAIAKIETLEAKVAALEAQ